MILSPICLLSVSLIQKVSPFQDPPADMSAFQLPNVVANPHMGNRSVESMVAVFAEAVESAIALARGDGEAPAHLLNPEVMGSAPRAQRLRAPRL